MESSIIVVSNALARVETIAPIDLFRAEVIDPIMATIRETVIAQASTLDISTPDNRAALASLAYKVGRSKTFIDGQRKNLVSEEKKRLAKIDAEGKRIWDTLEALQHEVRKPLTDWEDAEKQRVQDHENALILIRTTSLLPSMVSVADVESVIQAVEAFRSREWQEFSKRAEEVINAEITSLTSALNSARKREEEAAELARLRAEAAAREQKEREERIAREAVEREQREAKEREERSSREAAAREALIRKEKEDAEARANKAELEAKETAKRLEREKLEAVETERQRVEAKRLAEEKEQKERERDREHRSKVNNEAFNALVALGLSSDHAKMVVTAIAKGNIPNVKVVY
jgi:hypothetical protein